MQIAKGNYHFEGSTIVFYLCCFKSVVYMSLTVISTQQPTYLLNLHFSDLSTTLRLHFRRFHAPMANVACPRL